MENTRISHYAITRRLGRGGMGEVYQALDLDLGRTVALKFVAPELAADAEALRRLEREARSAAALQHPHIAILYAFERDAGRSFIAMEQMTGGSVRERLAGGRLPIGQALAIARDTAGALAHAHRRGIVHRDVKPENLMFSEGGIVKLMDFGLARATQASRLTMTGSALGTAAYMPPESTRGGAGPPGDIFALGVTLHEMMAGELPFTGDTPLALLYASANEPPRLLRTARPDAPPGVEALIQRMLAKDPAERPDATAVARELALMTGVPVPIGVDDDSDSAPVVAPARPPEEAAAVAGRRLPRWVVWLLLAMMPIAALTALLAVLVPGMFYESRSDRQTTAVALNNRGYQQLQADSLPQARASLEAALAVEPRYAPAMLNLGKVLGKLGDATGAAASFGRVIREHPDDRANTAIAHFELAEIAMNSGALARAIDHYRSALALDSTAVLYANHLGFALIQVGRPKEALAVLHDALDRFPGEARVHRNYGLALMRSDAAREAIPAFDRALELDPSLSSALGLRAEAKARLHDARGARSDWDAYLRMAHDETERPQIEARLRALGTLSN